ncbi:CBS domain-containing protein [Peptococcaceae bacterium 1198_IL3148]
MKAKDIMTTEVITVTEDTAIEQIAKILSENRISGVPVVNGEGKIKGIVTEGDLLHKISNPRVPGFVGLLGGIIYFNSLDEYKDDLKKLAAMKAEEIMTTDITTVSADANVEDMATLMVERGIKRLPVVEKDKVIGIISRADIIRTMAR